jgi:hypothetical protein
MNINRAVEIACEHFLQNLKPGSDTYQMLLHYAHEELELTGDDAAEYAMGALNGLQTGNGKQVQQFRRFFTWYCINYVVPDPPQA